MQIKYDLTGKKRKDMVQVISKAADYDAGYLGAPSFAYEIGDFTVTKDGTLEFSDRTDSEIVENVIETLREAGFEAENTAENEPAAAETETEETAAEDEPAADGTETSETAEQKPTATIDKTEIETTATEDDTYELEISISRSTLTDAQLDNLKKLVASKEGLIKTALGTDSIPIEVTEDKITFPWFPETDRKSVMAYNLFITKMCEMAKTQKRVTAKAKTVDNEKYAFRCFLLRLGFIGEEYKAARKILLKNLNGSSAFKVPKETEEEGNGETA